MTYQPGQWERNIAGGQNAYVVWRHYFMLDGLIGMVSVTQGSTATYLSYSIRLASGNEREAEYNERIDDLLPQLGARSIETAKAMIQRWLRFVGDRLVQLDYRDKGKQAIWTAIQHCLYQRDITVVTYGRTDEERNISRLLATNKLDSVALALQLADTLDIDLEALYPMQQRSYGGWEVLQTNHTYRIEKGSMGYTIDVVADHVLT